MATTGSRGIPATAETNWRSEPASTGTLAELAGDRGLAVEIGALRLVLLRLLEEDGDVGRLAGYVARVAGVAIQAAKAQESIAAGADDPFTAHMLAMAGDIPSSPSHKEDV